MKEYDRGYCPLLLIARMGRFEDMLCRKASCEWWVENEDAGYCAIHRIGGALEGIAEGLDFLNYLEQLP